MTKPKHAANRRRTCHAANSRRGAVLFIALVCLLIIMSILGQMLQGSLRAQRQLHPERDLRQAELLLQAGIDRAAYRLAREPDYRGETWQPVVNSIVGTAAGQDTIKCTRTAADKPWQVNVLAEYPLDGALTIRRSRSVAIQPATPTPQEK
jgi:hypothetical protein